MRRTLGYHVLFGVTLVALIALGGWWTVYINRTVELEMRTRRFELRWACERTARHLGQRPELPPLGPLPGDAGLELVARGSAGAGPPGAWTGPDALQRETLPRHAGFAVRARAETLQALQRKAHRRRVMAVGEGSLLFVLLGVCTVMLYRLVRQERRHLRRMEDFVSAVTHEMKTPLAGIKSMLQTLQAGRIPAEEQPRVLGLGLKEAERLQHTIENVLLSGSLRTERHHLQLHPLPLQRPLEDFLEHRRRFTPARPEALRLHWALAPPSAVVRADADALRVILNNLTDNAFKYGGAEPEVVLEVGPAAGAPPGALSLTVSDSGLGFDPARAEELFLPFRRALEHGQAVQHGTGLGLALSRSLARRMGGDLRGSSAGPGQGASFCLTLPRGDQV